MAVAGEHLRKRVEELESQLQDRARLLAEREAKLRALEARVDAVAAGCFRRAQALVESTEQPILLQLHRKIGPLRFRIRAGLSYSVVARLAATGWEVEAHLSRGSRTAAYATDEEFVEAQESLLQDLIGDALVALMTGRDILSTAAPSGRKGSQSFWVPWQRMFSTLAVHRQAEKIARTVRDATPSGTGR